MDLISSSRLAFGILRHDGAITPHPPVQRALDIVVDTLKKLGHEVHSHQMASLANMG